MMQKTTGVQYVSVDFSQAGRRIDNFLQLQLKGVPKTRIYQMIRKGEVRVNGSRVKQNHRVDEEDVVRIPPVKLPESSQEAIYFSNKIITLIEASLLYEDDALLVINKPSGLVVHSGSGQKAGVIEYLRHMRPELKFLELAHRLDRDTSGCLILVKQPNVLKQVQNVLKDHTIEKHYLAFVKGHLRESNFEVSQPLRKNTLSSGERIVRVDANGKHAVSRFNRLHQFNLGSLVEVELITGRTHQIRVHSHYMGHPIAMDSKYGDKEFNKRVKKFGLKRMFLHAHTMLLPLPNYTEPLHLEAPLNHDLEQFLERI